MEAQRPFLGNGEGGNDSNDDGLGQRERKSVINARNAGWGVYTGAKNEREVILSPDLISPTDYPPAYAAA